jgi:hypothetical protein
LTLPDENRGGGSIDQMQMRAELRLDHATTVKRRLLREICWCDTSGVQAHQALLPCVGFEFFERRIERRVFPASMRNAEWPYHVSFIIQ